MSVEKEIDENEPKMSSREINEETLRIVKGLSEVVADLQNTIGEIKLKIGFNDKSITRPLNRNENTDPGPFLRQPSN